MNVLSIYHLMVHDYVLYSLGPDLTKLLKNIITLLLVRYLVEDEQSFVTEHNCGKINYTGSAIVFHLRKYQNVAEEFTNFDVSTRIFSGTNLLSYTVSSA